MSTFTCDRQASNAPKSPPAELHRVSSIRVMRMVMQAMTGSSDRLLAPSGQQLSGDALQRLIQRLWHVTDDDLFGMGSAPVPRGTLRLLGSALLATPDVASALRLLGQCERALSGLPTLSVSAESTTATLMVDASALPNAAVTVALLAVTHRALMWATDAPVRLLAVRMPQSPSPAQDRHRALFGCDVTYRAPCAALVFDRAVLNQHLVRTQQDIDDLLKTAPLALLRVDESNQPHSDRVRRLLQESLGNQSVGCDGIAAMVGMSRQTLHRRLREENTSFLDLREQVSRDEALDSLNRGGETVAALAARLGFSESSAFTRAFRRWTGVSPSAYRLARARPVAIDLSDTRPDRTPTRATG